MTVGSCFFSFGIILDEIIERVQEWKVLKSNAKSVQNQNTNQNEHHDSEVNRVKTQR